LKAWEDKHSALMEIRETSLFRTSSVTKKKKGISMCSLMLEIEAVMKARTGHTVNVNINLSTESIHSDN